MPLDSGTNVYAVKPIAHGLHLSFLCGWDPVGPDDTPLPPHLKTPDPSTILVHRPGTTVQLASIDAKGRVRRAESFDATGRSPAIVATSSVRAITWIDPQELIQVRIGRVEK